MPTPWQVFAKLTGLGVDFSIEICHYGRARVPALRLYYQPDSEQEEAVRELQESLNDQPCQDALVALTAEHLCDPHAPDVSDVPFVPPGLVITAKGKRGDPAEMRFKNRRGQIATWKWRRLGMEWQWAKTR